MKYIISVVFLVCGIAVSCHASDPSFKVESIQDKSGKIIQTIEFVSDADLPTKYPEKIKTLMALPQAPCTLLDPCQMFTYDQRGLSQNFYPATMDQYIVAQVGDIKAAEYKFMLTSDLCECVGISIYDAKTGCGMMHAGFNSLPKLVTQFLRLFPQNRRASAKVVLLSGYYSDVLAEVYTLLVQEGYKDILTDVIPVYLACRNRTSSGTKYMSYERLGFTKEDATRLSSLTREKIEVEVNPRIVRNLELADSHRILITDMRDGKSYQFFKRGCGEASSQIVHKMYEVRKGIEQLRLPPVAHQMIMTKAIKSIQDTVVQMQALVALAAKQSQKKDEEKK